MPGAFNRYYNTMKEKDAAVGQSSYRKSTPSSTGGLRSRGASGNRASMSVNKGSKGAPKTAGLRKTGSRGYCH